MSFTISITLQQVLGDTRFEDLVEVFGYRLIKNCLLRRFFLDVPDDFD